MIKSLIRRFRTLNIVTFKTTKTRRYNLTKNGTGTTCYVAHYKGKVLRKPRSSTVYSDIIVGYIRPGWTDRYEIDGEITKFIKTDSIEVEEE